MFGGHADENFINQALSIYQLGKGEVLEEDLMKIWEWWELRCKC